MSRTVSLFQKLGDRVPVKLHRINDLSVIAFCSTSTRVVMEAEAWDRAVSSSDRSGSAEIDVFCCVPFVRSIKRRPRHARRVVFTRI